MVRWPAVFCALTVVLGVLSCSEAPSDRAARHESRGDGYVQQEKFPEAVIEYKNAARGRSVCSS